jgi:hypothetical protein
MPLELQHSVRLQSLTRDGNGGLRHVLYACRKESQT